MARLRSGELLALPALLIRLIQAAKDSNNQSGAKALRDEACVYAGLAFGVTLADFGSSR